MWPITAMTGGRARCVICRYNTKMWRKKRVYLDSAAGVASNPSSPHTEGRRSREALERARLTMARLIECKSDDIIFTSCATEANNLAIQGLAKSGAHMLYLPSAHASIVETMRALESRGISIEALPIREGRVDIEATQKLLRPETLLVSIDAVCGETGTVWDTREVKRILPKHTYLHVDASQAPFVEKLTRSHFDADLLVFDGSKVGVRGAGCLIAPRTIPLAPLVFGGGQERGLRSGTENVEAIKAFADALSAAEKGRETFFAHATRDRKHLVEALMGSGISDIYINECTKVAPHIINLSLVGRDTDYLVTLLDAAGFAVSTRSACESDKTEGPRAVLALTRDRARALSSVRISWGREARSRDLARFAEALVGAVAFIDKTTLKSHY